MNPELYSLSQIDWQFFATLTFKQEKLSEAVRVKMFFAWLRTQAKHGGIHFKKLIWFVRSERGEQTGRKHFHALLAGLPEWMLKTETNFAMMNSWENLGGGMARVSLYSANLNGVEYTLKGLNSETDKVRQSKDNYEAAKFGGSCDLMLSKSLVTVLQGRRWIGERDSSTQRNAA